MHLTASFKNQPILCGLSVFPKPSPLALLNAHAYTYKYLYAHTTIKADKEYEIQSFFFKLLLPFAVSYIFALFFTLFPPPTSTP